MSRDAFGSHPAHPRFSDQCSELAVVLRVTAQVSADVIQLFPPESYYTHSITKSCMTCRTHCVSYPSLCEMWIRGNQLFQGLEITSTLRSYQVNSIYLRVKHVRWCVLPRPGLTAVSKGFLSLICPCLLSSASLCWLRFCRSALEG